MLHTHFGRPSWPHLLVGPISLAQKGFLVDTSLASACPGQQGPLSNYFADANGTPLGPGHLVTNTKLAAVLHKASLAPTPDLSGDAC